MDIDYIAYIAMLPDSHKAIFSLIYFRSPRNNTNIMEGITVHVFSTDEKFKVQHSCLHLHRTKVAEKSIKFSIINRIIETIIFAPFFQDHWNAILHAANAKTCSRLPSSNQIARSKSGKPRSNRSGMV